jgi:hypothetical protein
MFGSVYIYRMLIPEMSFTILFVLYFVSNKCVYLIISCSVVIFVLMFHAKYRSVYCIS